MKRYIDIGNYRVGLHQPVFIIAEAGVNHNGSLSLAKKMIDAAKSAGADAVKFQTFKTEELVTRNAPKAGYQKKTAPGESQFEMLKRLELKESRFKELFAYCRKKGIMFLSTPFDFQSAEFLYKLGVEAFKIGSGDMTNTSLLLKVAGYKKPIILSTGMADLREISEAIQAIYSTGNKRLILLHCTSNYPTRHRDVNLKAMDTLRRCFSVPVGYSDHTIGIEVSIAAAARGACVIERHFTLDRDLPGPDHKASMEADEMKKMISSIRNMEKALGNGVKAPQRSEIEIKKVARKSIIAACRIPRGTKLTLDMLSIKRPGSGIEPGYLNRLVNKKTRVEIKKDQILTWEKVGT